MVPFLHIGLSFSLFTIIFFLARRKLRLENILASAFLFFLAAPIITKLISMRLIRLPVPEAFLLLWTYPFTYGPFLYLYTKVKIDVKPVFKKIYLLHFLPFAFFTFLPFVFPQLQSFQPAPFVNYSIEKMKFYDNEMSPPSFKIPGIEGMNPGSFPPSGQIPKQIQELTINRSAEAYVFTVFLISSFSIYTILIFMLLKKHKKEIKNYFSYDSIKLNLKWLQWITLYFAISYIFVSLTILIKIGTFRSLIFNPFIAPDFAITLFIVVFCLFSVMQPVIFKNSDPSDETDINGNITSKETKKYKKSSLKDAEALIYLDQLEIIMKSEKPHLNADLTIKDMSNKLNIPKHHLTQILNERLNKNFFMFVNEYRVQEAKLMMEDNKYMAYTIIRIAYESGFNTKSGFNNVFKKFTGCTPTEYRNNILLRKQIKS